MDKEESRMVVSDDDDQRHEDNVKSPDVRTEETEMCNNSQDRKDTKGASGQVDRRGLGNTSGDFPTTSQDESNFGTGTRRSQEITDDERMIGNSESADDKLSLCLDGNVKETDESGRKRRKRCQYFSNIGSPQELVSTDAQITDGKSNKKELRNWKPVTSNSANVMGTLKCTKKTGCLVQALPKLPPEILQMIMGHLKDTTDLQNCSKAAPILDDLLIVRKPNYLFAQAFPHIVKRILNHRDIINCRVVCQTWKNGVDITLQNRPATRPYDDEYFLNEMSELQPRLNGGLTPYTIFHPTVSLKSTVTSLDSFQAAYDSLNFNGLSPFLGGSLEVVVEIENLLELETVVQSQLQRMKLFLTTFGRHIEYVRLASIQEGPLIRYLSFMLSMQLMKQCPNLKSFSVRGAWNFAHLPNIEEYIRSLRNNANVLPHLHTLDLFQPAFTPRVITKFLVSAYLPQLQKLTLSHWSGDLGSELPNLRELKLACIDSNKVLEQLAQVTAPVQKLCLVFRFSKLNMDILQRVLARFPVRHLELSWINECRPIVPKTRPPLVTLQIPTVHTLMLGHSPDVNYSFLRWFPNLCHLFLSESFPNIGPLQLAPLSARVMKRIALYEAVQIHKHLYDLTMLDSNIWNLFKSLKSVVFERERAATLERIRNARYLNIETWNIAWERDFCYMFP